MSSCWYELDLACAYLSGALSCMRITVFMLLNCPWLLASARIVSILLNCLEDICFKVRVTVIFNSKQTAIALSKL